MTPEGRSRGVAAVGLALGVGLHGLPLGARQAPDDELTALLARVYEYVEGYQRHVASLICEEHYEQRVSRLAGVTRKRGAAIVAARPARRVLQSDYLLVQLPDRQDWEPLRDVHTVDGRPVREREQRLERLFLSPSSSDARQQVDAIRVESRRYNIGSVLRDINVPTYALAFLGRELRERFTFRLRGRERVDGVDTRVIELEETARPTLIAGEGGTDSPARGRFWIDPRDGAIVQTRLETRSGQLRTRIDVVYRPEPRLGFRVPVSMSEVHEMPGETIEGTARYEHFRQFRVETFELFGPPR